MFEIKNNIISIMPVAGVLKFIVVLCDAEGRPVVERQLEVESNGKDIAQASNVFDTFTFLAGYPKKNEIYKFEVAPVDPSKGAGDYEEVDVTGEEILKWVKSPDSVETAIKALNTRLNVLGSELVDDKMSATTDEVSKKELVRIDSTLGDITRDIYAMLRADARTAQLSSMASIRQKADDILTRLRDISNARQVLRSQAKAEKEASRKPKATEAQHIADQEETKRLAAEKLEASRKAQAEKDELEKKKAMTIPFAPANAPANAPATPPPIQPSWWKKVWNKITGVWVHILVIFGGLIFCSLLICGLLKGWKHPFGIGRAGQPTLVNTNSPADTNVLGGYIPLGNPVQTTPQPTKTLTTVVEEPGKPTTVRTVSVTNDSAFNAHIKGNNGRIYQIGGDYYGSGRGSMSEPQKWPGDFIPDRVVKIIPESREVGGVWEKVYTLKAGEDVRWDIPTWWNTKSFPESTFNVDVATDNRRADGDGKLEENGSSFRYRNRSQNDIKLGVRCTKLKEEFNFQQ